MAKPSTRTKRLIVNIQPELVEAFKGHGFKPGLVGYRLLRDFALKQNIVTPEELKAMTTGQPQP